jgi:hypothetical protein
LEPESRNKSFSRIGLLLNPRAGRVSPHLGEVRYIASQIRDIHIQEASTLAEINRAIEALMTIDPELLIIIAGDGTVQAVLTCLFSLKKSKQKIKLPRFLIVPGGTTNMTASDMGVRGHPISVLERIVKSLDKKKIKNIAVRPAMHIQQSGQADIYGMFFGAGMIASGTKYFLKHVRDSGITGEFASFIVMMKLLMKLIKGEKSEYTKPVQLRFNDHSETVREMNSILLFATTLDRLLFGLKPYWGEHRTPVHFTCIRDKASFFWLSLLRIILRLGGTLSEEGGYYSSNNKQIKLLIDGDFIIDGEIFRSDKQKGPIKITATEMLTFIVP